MMTQAENDLLTRTGPGTPCGELLRCYWQPVGLSGEIPLGGAPVPVTAMGEALVLFRNEFGEAGLIGRHCSHRGADLSYGRIEGGGLRCLYHGWLYDTVGRCLEQPGEPADSGYKDEIRHTGYPCREAGGAVFAFMGSGAAPEFPNYQFLEASADHCVENKVFVECNYLQANEGNIDPVHTSYLHRQVQSYGAKHRDAGGVDQQHYFFQRQTSPSIEIERTRFGIRIYATREADAGKMFLRITNFVLPNLCAIGGNETRYGPGGYTVHWHVPIDDFTHWRFEWIFHSRKPIDKKPLLEAIQRETTPDFRHRRDAANRYGQDRDEMRDRTFTGMGRYFPAQDAFAVETQGAIQDRTRENLGTTDIAIAAARRQLGEAIEAVRRGEDPPHVVRRADDNDFRDIVVFSEVVDADRDVRALCAELAADDIYAHEYG